MSSEGDPWTSRHGHVILKGLDARPVSTSERSPNARRAAKLAGDMESLIVRVAPFEHTMRKLRESDCRRGDADLIVARKERYSRAAFRLCDHAIRLG